MYLSFYQGSAEPVSTRIPVAYTEMSIIAAARNRGHPTQVAFIRSYINNMYRIHPEFPKLARRTKPEILPQTYDGFAVWVRRMIEDLEGRLCRGARKDILKDLNGFLDKHNDRRFEQLMDRVDNCTRVAERFDDQCWTRKTFWHAYKTMAAHFPHEKDITEITEFLDKMRKKHGQFTELAARTRVRGQGPEKWHPRTLAGLRDWVCRMIEDLHGRRTSHARRVLLLDLAVALKALE